MSRLIAVELDTEGKTVLDVNGAKRVVLFGERMLTIIRDTDDSGDDTDDAGEM